MQPGRDPFRAWGGALGGPWSQGSTLISLKSLIPRILSTPSMLAPWYLRPHTPVAASCRILRHGSWPNQPQFPCILFGYSSTLQSLTVICNQPVWRGLIHRQPCPWGRQLQQLLTVDASLHTNTVLTVCMTLPTVPFLACLDSCTRLELVAFLARD